MVILSLEEEVASVDGLKTVKGIYGKSASKRVNPDRKTVSTDCPAVFD